MMARREKKYRQTYPGPNSEDNQQMLQDIRDTLDHHQNRATDTYTTTTTVDRERSVGVAAPPSVGERDMRVDRESRDTRRPSPPSDREQGLPSASPGTTPRMQQNRSTPTKQLASDGTQQKLREIRKSLRPFAYSDPGFHAAKDKVNKKMLEQLINLGYNEVGIFQ